MTRDNGKLYWHWQNLTKDDGRGNFPWHGRGWLNLNSVLRETRGSERYGDFQDTLNVEWNFGRPRLRLGFGVQADCEYTVSLDMGFLFGGIHLHVDSPRLAKWLEKVAKRHYDRQFSFYWYEMAFWLQLWGPEDDMWESRQRWYQKMHAFHLDDFFLGPTKYSKEVAETLPVEFLMDGRTYTAIATRETCTWKRPRWFARTRKFIDISFNPDVCHPPQFAGKGENSWDQGDDAIWATSFQTEDLDTAIDKYKQAVRGRRHRYGMPSESK